MNTQDEYQWSVNLVRDRYAYLSLTFEQAELIYKYELERDTNSDKYYFSQWEEWDFELTSFQEILAGEQLNGYQKFRNESIESYIKNLIELDSKSQSDIDYKCDLISFYELQFLPEIRADMFLNFFWLHSDTPKIEYLRREYKRFLDDTKKEILTSHFRHNRIYRPNALKASLLQHKLSCILPDYFRFQHVMDNPTKSVAAYLKSRVKTLPPETESLVSRKFEELITFNQSNLNNHFGNIEGWHVFGRLSPEEEKIHRNMSLLLLDKDSYGC